MAEDLRAEDTGFILVRASLESETDLLPAEAPTFNVGTRVQVLESERMPDGRFNLLVEGLEAVLIEEIPSSRPYRQARWRALATPEEPWPAEERDTLVQALQHYFKILKIPFEVVEEQAYLNMTLKDVAPLAAALDLALPERQFLLEAPGLREMARRLEALLRFAATGRQVPDA